MPIHAPKSVVVLLLLVCLSACTPLNPVIQQHHDNLVVMNIDRDLGAYDGGAEVKLAKEFYKHYEDAFDVLVVVSNLSEAEALEAYKRQGHERLPYQGLMSVVRNAVYGNGYDIFDQSHLIGTSGKLKGIMHIPIRANLIQGPVLHELMHVWVGDDVIPTQFESHWGFSSVHGQLGGFNQENLTELGNGQYTAGRFGVIANYGNSVPYAPLELYLAGWIPSHEVPDILIANNASWVKRDGENDRVFSATGWTTISVKDIINRIGERIPTHEESPREFRMAVILLATHEFPVTAEHLSDVSNYIRAFTRNASVRHIPGLETYYNFWDATGGHATMDAAGLKQYRVVPESLKSGLHR